MPKEQHELSVVEQHEKRQRKQQKICALNRLSGADVATSTQVEIEQLKGERDQLLDRVARLQAEFENARKRAEREKADYRDYATGNVVEQFLPVVDNFELALKSTSTAEQLRHGVELIVKQMDDVLRQLQVNPIPTVGEAFDPRFHEALGSVEREDLPISMWPRRYGADISCASGFCGRHWSAWRITLNR